jgi:hypothetical protein
MIAGEPEKRSLPCNAQDRTKKDHAKAEFFIRPGKSFRDPFCVPLPREQMDTLSLSG